MGQGFLGSRFAGHVVDGNIGTCGGQPQTTGTPDSLGSAGYEGCFAIEVLLRHGYLPEIQGVIRSDGGGLHQVGLAACFTPLTMRLQRDPAG